MRHAEDKEWSWLSATLQLSAGDSGIIIVNDDNDEDDGNEDGSLDYIAIYRNKSQ
jgi:hypothetical protein